MSCAISGIPAQAGKHQICWDFAVNGRTEDLHQLLTEEDQQQDEQDRQLAFERFPHQISYDYHFKYARKNPSFCWKIACFMA
jgi:hypothetical protein